MDEQQRINISGFQKPAPAEEHVPICCAKRPNDLAYSKPETARSFDDEFANEGDPVATDGRVPVLTEGEGVATNPGAMRRAVWPRMTTRRGRFSTANNTNNANNANAGASETLNDTLDLQARPAEIK